MADSHAIAAPRTSRIDAVDWLRGLVMVIMALTTRRDFFTIGIFNAEDPTAAPPDLFFTRWITHFCAPTFVLLAGAGAYLFALVADRAPNSPGSCSAADSGSSSSNSRLSAGGRSSISITAFRSAR